MKLNEISFPESTIYYIEDGINIVVVNGIVVYSNDKKYIGIKEEDLPTEKLHKIE